MFVLVTVEALYYGEPLRTYATHEAAYMAGVRLFGWWDIERVF